MFILKIGAVALCAAVAAAQTYDDLPFVDPASLEKTITSEALLQHAQKLEDFAYASPDKNRLMGTQGHNDTVTYLYEQLTSLGGYYNTSLQQWSALVQLSGDANFTVNGVDQGASVMDYSPSGVVTAPLAAVSNLGCNLTDYPPEVSGSIAIISRGECQFGEKSVNAGLAGAVGAVIYNNLPNEGGLNGTLGLPREEGPYVPTAGFSLENGTALVDLIQSGEVINGTLSVETEIENRTTFNVIAQSVGGDQNNVLALGAHTDSVAAGPGINDDGSGTVGILETAIQLSKFQTHNSVRFGFWSGEEEGLLGSTVYVASLSDAELAKIRLYLNFDMIASPNFEHAIYDGDGSDFNITGPQGSAETEGMFEQYFSDNGINFTSTAFDGRSDYGPFLDAGVACGGTFTGAEENKTEEDFAKFGGQVGVAFDENYHGPGDNVTNLNMEAFLIHSKAIAHAVALYSDSFDSLGQNVSANGTLPTRPRVRRWGAMTRKGKKIETGQTPAVEMGNAQKISKPWSFAKERPVWGPRVVRKSLAGAPSKTGVSKRNIGMRVVKRSKPVAKREELLRRARKVYDVLSRRKAFA